MVVPAKLRSRCINKNFHGVMWASCRKSGRRKPSLPHRNKKPPLDSKQGEVSKVLTLLRIYNLLDAFSFHKSIPEFQLRTVLLKHFINGDSENFAYFLNIYGTRKRCAVFIVSNSCAVKLQQPCNIRLRKFECFSRTFKILGKTHFWQLLLL